MASVKFIGEAHGPNQTVTWHGHTFKANEAVKTDHEGLIEAASANPFFEVSGAKASKAKKDEGEEDEKPAEFGSYSVEHRGRGKYAVVQGDTVIADSMSKAEAETHARGLMTPPPVED